MKKYIDFIFNNRRLLIILFISLNIFSLFGLFRIKLDTDFASFSPEESIYQDRLDDLENTFGKLNQLIVLVGVDDINDSSLQDMYQLQRDLEQINDVSFVEGAAPEQFLINGTPTDFDQLSSEQIINYYSNFEDFSPIKMNSDTNYFVFTLFISDNFSKSDIRDVENTLDQLSYNTYLSGDSYNQLKITDYIIKILLILPPLTILIMLSVFRWQMGSIKPTILSVLPAAIGALWTLGLIGWIGNEVSILTAVVPIFIIVIGSADGLHFLSHYQDSIAEGKTTKEGLVSTLRLVGMPMIVTTLTSMVGFLSLLTIQTSSIIDLSVFASVGILLAGVATWYILPLILSTHIDVSRKKHTKHKLDIAKGIKKLYGIPSLIIVAIIIVITVFFYHDINNEFNMLMIYKNSTIVQKNAAKVAEVNGGSIPIYVTIQSNFDVISMDELNEVDSVANTLNALPEVNKVVNPFHLLNIVYSSQHAGDIPNDIVLNALYTQISSDPNNTLNDLISREHNTIRILVFPRDLNNQTLDTIEASVSNNPDITVTGVQYLMKDLNDSISVSQLESILLALGLVFIMLIITLRSFKIAFYSLIPIMITTVSLYGFLGVSQIPLNITTVIIFSITIGVGIDYAVHFSSVYRYYLKEEHYSNKEAIEKSFKNSSRPIIANSLGISLGFTALTLSPLTIHFNISMLMWVSMVVSVLLTLTLLPFIFNHLGGKKHA